MMTKKTKEKTSQIQIDYQEENVLVARIPATFNKGIVVLILDIIQAGICMAFFFGTGMGLLITSFITNTHLNEFTPYSQTVTVVLISCLCLLGTIMLLMIGKITSVQIITINNQDKKIILRRMWFGIMPQNILDAPFSSIADIDLAGRFSTRTKTPRDADDFYFRIRSAEKKRSFIVISTHMNVKSLDFKELNELKEILRTRVLGNPEGIS